MYPDIIKAIRYVIFTALVGMWVVLYYNICIHRGHSFLTLLSKVTFFTQWGMFFTTFQAAIAIFVSPGKNEGKKNKYGCFQAWKWHTFFF